MLWILMGISEMGMRLGIKSVLEISLERLTRDRLTMPGRFLMIAFLRTFRFFKGWWVHLMNESGI